MGWCNNVDDGVLRIDNMGADDCGTYLGEVFTGKDFGCIHWTMKPRRDFDDLLLTVARSQAEKPVKTCINCASPMCAARFMNVPCSFWIAKPVKEQFINSAAGLFELRPCPNGCGNKVYVNTNDPLMFYCDHCVRKASEAEAVKDKALIDAADDAFGDYLIFGSYRSGKSFAVSEELKRVCTTPHVHMADGQRVDIEGEQPTNVHEVILHGYHNKTKRIKVYPCHKGHPNCYHEDLRKVEDGDIPKIGDVPVIDGVRFKRFNSSTWEVIDRRNRKPRIHIYSHGGFFGGYRLSKTFSTAEDVICRKFTTPAGKFVQCVEDERIKQRRVKDAFLCLFNNIDGVKPVEAFTRNVGDCVVFRNRRTATKDRRGALESVSCDVLVIDEWLDMWHVLSSLGLDPFNEYPYSE